MSFTLPPVAISGTGGSLDLSNAPAQIIALDIYNASPLDLLVQGLPAGDFWLTINQGIVVYTRGAATAFGHINFALGQALSIVASPSSSVLITGYVAGDVPPPPGTYYVGRLQNIGNGGVVTSQSIQGANQTLSLTELDAAGPALAPSSGAGAKLVLSARDNSNNRVDMVQLDAVANTVEMIKPLKIDTNISSLGGQATAGIFGAPVIVGIASANVTTTGGQTILSVAAPALGLYRVSCGLVVNNSVSGNALRLLVQYAWFSFNPIYNLAILNNGVVMLNAVNSIANGVYNTLPVTFLASQGAVISVQYTDPTNVPSDSLWAVLERLG